MALSLGNSSTKIFLVVLLVLVALPARVEAFGAGSESSFV